MQMVHALKTNNKLKFLALQVKVSDFIYSICTSHIFYLFMTAISAICFATQNQVVGGCILITIMIVQALFVKDISVMFLPFCLLSMMLINLYKATPNDFKNSLLPLAGVFLVAFVAHFIIFRIKLQRGKQFWAICFVSLAVIWGGGLLTPLEDYFKPVNIFFTCGLSIGMLMVYVACRNSMFIEGKCDALKVISKAMIYVGIMGVMIIFPYIYFLLFNKVEFNIQWQNNLSTFMFVSMPFAFYYATKSKFSVVYFCLGIAEYLVCFFSFSRSGMLLGTMLIVVCIVTSFVTDKRKTKWINLLPTALFLGMGLIVMLHPDAIEKLKQILEIDFGDEVRTQLMETALRNFMHNPLFGAGLSFVGDDYVNKGFTIYLYHSSIFQIIGSFGLVGLAAYGFQFGQHMKIMFGKAKIFNVYLMISFCALHAMSLVNPGIISPLPYGLLLIVIATIAEIANEKNSDPSEGLHYKFMKKFYKKHNANFA